MTQQIIVTRRIEIQWFGEAERGPAHIIVGQVLHQQHDGLGIGGRVEIGQAQEKGVSIWDGKEPERTEALARNDKVRYIMLRFAQDGRSKTRAGALHLDSAALRSG